MVDVGALLGATHADRFEDDDPLLMGLIRVVFVCELVVKLTPTASQADYSTKSVFGRIANQKIDLTGEWLANVLDERENSCIFTQ